MNEDKELLTLAAKAAGIELDKGWLVYLEDDGEAFNPLVRDDHALRLAVKLGIGLYYAASYVHACKPSGVTLWEPREIDDYAATRRAIVRAAADIWTTNERKRTAEISRGME